MNAPFLLRARIVPLVLLLFAAISTPIVAIASPIIFVGEGGNVSWTDGLNNGNIQPFAGPLNDQQNAFYANSITQGPTANGFQFSPVIKLVPDLNVDVDGEIHQSLVMTWDPPDETTFPNELGIAGWQYVYDQDPDFTNATVHFSIGPPVNAPAIWDLSFELIDSQNRVRSWFLMAPQLGWQNHWITANDTSSQGPWFFQGQTPGFDITQVVAIQFDGAAFNGALPFPPPPPGTTLPAWDWLPFNHLRVAIVPEPSTMGLLAIGLLGIVTRRRRKR